MEKYEKPCLELIKVSKADIITDSTGTETTPMPDNGMVWDLDIN